MTLSRRSLLAGIVALPFVRPLLPSSVLRGLAILSPAGADVLPVTKLASTPWKEAEGTYEVHYHGRFPIRFRTRGQEYLLANGESVRITTGEPCSTSVSPGVTVTL